MIGINTFSPFSNLRNNIIIGNNAFRSCKNMNNFSIKGNFIIIGEQSFYDCQNVLKYFNQFHQYFNIKTIILFLYKYTKYFN